MLQAALALHPLPVGSHALGARHQAALCQPLRKIQVGPVACASSARNLRQPMLALPADRRPSAAPEAVAVRQAPTSKQGGPRPAWATPPPHTAAAAAAAPATAATAMVPTAVRAAPAPTAPAVCCFTAPPAVDTAVLGRQLAESHPIPLSYLRSLLVLA